MPSMKPMHLKRKRRLIAIIVGVSGISIAVALVLMALRNNIDLYYTPQQALAAHLSPQTHFRLGGMVKRGSVVRDANSLDVSFVLTDFHREMRVHYRGVLPNLFRQGQGIVAEGHLTQAGSYEANQVLAKHDEKYRPPNIAAKGKA